MVSKGDRNYLISGAGGWKSIEMMDENGALLESKKFRKTEFNEIMKDQFWGPVVDIALEDAMIKKMGTTGGVDINPESYEEVREINNLLDFDENDL